MALGREKQHLATRRIRTVKTKYSIADRLFRLKNLDTEWELADMSLMRLRILYLDFQK